jgi:hypothetical protein
MYTILRIVKEREILIAEASPIPDCTPDDGHVDVPDHPPDPVRASTSWDAYAVRRYPSLTRDRAFRREPAPEEGDEPLQAECKDAQRCPSTEVRRWRGPENLDVAEEDGRKRVEGEGYCDCMGHHQSNP